MIKIKIKSDIFSEGELELTEPEIAAGMVVAILDMASEPGHRPMSFTVTTETVPDVPSFNDPNWLHRIESEWKASVASGRV